MLNLRSRKYYIWVIKTEFELAQPVGVGYSYTEKGDKGVWTTEAAAKDVSGGRLGGVVDQLGAHLRLPSIPCRFMRSCRSGSALSTGTLAPMHSTVS